MLISDGIGIRMLRKKYPKEHDSLGSPVHYWTDVNKVSYIVGYVGLFRFLSLSNNKIRIVLTIQAISFWASVGFLFHGFYDRLG